MNALLNGVHFLLHWKLSYRQLSISLSTSIYRIYFQASNIASVKPIGVTCDDILAKSPDFDMNESVVFLIEVGRLC
ncbi:hypothetical protein [Flammeovirga sp. EKP202]|uniref:hypothetical protein n=1 Tax=Flammeovirga sp. EKP202 TaxID=2770592 RepID=UPI00165FB1C8|nr:hypothetical protein [Flammeovirga sp. EKP202]MBD0404651.1 hypothetical protein [Flammeovirga sp. EKP202]